jgi:hypothetical protein
MEDQAEIENLKKEVVGLIEIIKSGTLNPEAANVIIDCAETISKTYTLQLKEEPPAVDFLSKEINELNYLIRFMKCPIPTEALQRYSNIYQQECNR